MSIAPAKVAVVPTRSTNVDRTPSTTTAGHVVEKKQKLDNKSNVARHWKEIGLGVSVCLVIGLAIGLYKLLGKPTTGTASTGTTSTGTATTGTATTGTATTGNLLVKPGVPTSVSAVAATQSANVSFVAPVNVGTSAITSFTVTSSPGGMTASGLSSPITVTGLTAGTSYTFSVTATSAAGTSVASSASTPIVAIFPTQSVFSKTTVPGTNGTAKSFNKPFQVGEVMKFSVAGQITALSMYLVQAPPSDLVGGYVLTLQSQASGSTTVTTLVSTSPITQTTPGWVTVPLSTPITVSTNTTYCLSYITGIGLYAQTPTGVSRTTLMATNNITVTSFRFNSSGITNLLSAYSESSGDCYFVDVVFLPSAAIATTTATTQSFTEQSIASLPLPEAPTNVTAVQSGTDSALISFTPSQDNSVYRYTYFCSDMSISGGMMSSPFVVSQLKTGQSYTFYIMATNATGNSSVAATSNTLIMT